MKLTYTGESDGVWNSVIPIRVKINENANIDYRGQEGKIALVVATHVADPEEVVLMSDNRGWYANPRWGGRVLVGYLVDLEEVVRCPMEVQ